MHPATRFLGVAAAGLTLGLLACGGDEFIGNHSMPDYPTPSVGWSVELRYAEARTPTRRAGIDALDGLKIVASGGAIALPRSLDCVPGELAPAIDAARGGAPGWRVDPQATLATLADPRLPGSPVPELRSEQLRNGDYGAFSGVIAKVEWGGAAAQAMVLESPVRVEGRAVQRLLLRHPIGFELGEKLELFGRVRELWTPLRGDDLTVGLEGISNLSAGEPRFDGTWFSDASDRHLVVLSWDAFPEAIDDPMLIAVLDPHARRAFVGWMGGYLPLSASPFPGFVDARAIEPPGAEDCGRVILGEDGRLRTPTGEGLELVGLDRSGAEGRSWWLERDAGRIYELRSAGLEIVLANVIRL